MKRALLFCAALLLSTPPAFGRVPELDVTALCNGRAADAKLMRSTPDQSIADCVRDEEAAKQQLSTLWVSIPAPIRTQCASESRSLGTSTYLDLLTCMQIAVDVKSGPKQDTGKR
jgi:hypothetical protein